MVRASLFYPKDGEVDTPILFKTPIGTRLLEPRERYRAYQCKICGKIDPNVVFSVGLPILNFSSIRLDYFETYDTFPIVSTALADCLKELCADAVSFLPVGATGYHVLRCRDHVAPAENSRLYGPLEPADPNDVFQPRAERCSNCGRFREVTFQPWAYNFPHDFSIFTFDVEQVEYLAFYVCCSPSVGEQLLAKKFKGLWLSAIT